MSALPRFSIVTPVGHPRQDHFRATVDSVLAQEFVDWEWILVDVDPEQPAVTEAIRGDVQEDARIQVIQRPMNGSIDEALNAGVACATGEWIVLLDDGDLLVPRPLWRVNEAIRCNPRAGYVYSDEDVVDDEGKRLQAFSKPDWSPERLRHQMYLGHLSVLRRDLVTNVGGFREGFDGAEVHDLALRVTEHCQEVVHIPEVLYCRRKALAPIDGSLGRPDEATNAGVKAVQDHLVRVGRGCDRVEATHVPETYSITRLFDPGLRVSVIIPTRGSEALIWGCKRVLAVETVRSLLSHTNHRNLEIIVVYDKETPESVLGELKSICGYRLVLKSYDRPFNFSEKCNSGFMVASGDILVFLNDDMEITSSSFIESLCAPLQESGIGLTGAFLTYPNGLIQHAGLVIQETDFMHAYLGHPSDALGYFNELVLDHEVSALTAACVAVRREVFSSVGGFTVALPMNFNDVDFSYKIRALGLRLVWLSEARAVHLESVTRETQVHDWEVRMILDRWGTPQRDPYMPFEADRMLALTRSARGE